MPSPHHHAIHRRGRRTRAGGGAGRARGPGDAGGSSRRGEGLWRSASRRACRNHEPCATNSQSALLVAGPPGKSLLPGRGRRLPGHGPARPPEQEGGRGSWELSFLPSFLSLKSKSLPRGGARAAARAGSAVSLLGSAAHVGFRRRDPARQHFPATAAGTGAWGLAAAPAHLLPPTLGKPPGGGSGAEGVAGAGAAAPNESGGSCSDCAQRPPARALPAARPPATPGGPSRLAAHRARPGARAAHPPAPRAPRPAAGCRRESMPGASSPRARSGSALPGPWALSIGRPACVSPAARPTQKVPAALRPPARVPAPAIFVNLQLPSEPEKLKGRAGAERQRETPPPPRAAPRSAAVGAPSVRRAAGGCPGPGPSRPRSPPPPPRPQPPWSQWASRRVT